MDVTRHPNCPRSRFEIVRPITERPGQNNDGIFVVEHVTTGEYCVEKRLKTADVANGYAQREIDVLSQLSGHPNIIQLVDYQLNNDPQLQECDLSARTWTEYCEYGSLRNFVDYLQDSGNPRLSEPLLWHILASLAEAVRYLQQGPKELPFLSWNTVCHRDIHLGNVFLAAEPAGSNFPRVVLGDFGSSTTVAHTLFGYNSEWAISWFEEFFAPPEFPSYYPESDIYQIGAVLYCLMYGQHSPYYGTAPRLVHGKRGYLDHDIWVRELQFDAPYSDALVDIVSACLCGDVFSRCNIDQLLEMLGKI